MTLKFKNTNTQELEEFREQLIDEITKIDEQISKAVEEQKKVAVRGRKLLDTLGEVEDELKRRPS